MQSPLDQAGLSIVGQPARPAGDHQEGENRHCPYCHETISVNARKCWRCHEYFSLPREDLDDRAFQLARREVLQDCLVDIKKWITRIGVGSMAGLLLIGTLSVFRFQDMLEGMVSDRVAQATAPVLDQTEEKLDETEEVLDDVERSILLAQHRISQFDEIDSKLVEANSAILKISQAKQGLESRAESLGDQFASLETRFLSAKRELRDDRERRLEETLGNFASQMVTYNKLNELLSQTDDAQNQRLLAAMQPMALRRISLLSPFTLSSDKPTVVFAPSVRLEWQLDGYEVGEVVFRVRYGATPDLQRSGAGQGDTRLSYFTLPAGLPHGPVYWQVEAIDAQGQVRATSDLGHFEFYASSIDRIRSTGIVRVGVACSDEGEFAYYDESKGRLTGYDIELTRLLAQRLMPSLPGVRPEFVSYSWSRLLNSVRRNEVDMIISTITITPQREEEYGLKFSKPYYSTHQACIVLEGSEVSSAAQLHGRRIAVQAGTSSETVAEAFTDSTNLERVASSDIAIEDLVRGKVDAVITDYDFAQTQIRQLGQPATAFKLQVSDFPENYNGVRVEQYGIAVAKPESDLLQRLNNAIDSVRRDNQLQTLKARHVRREYQAIALKRLPAVQPERR